MKTDIFGEPITSDYMIKNLESICQRQQTQIDRLYDLLMDPERLANWQAKIAADYAEEVNLENEGQ